VKKESAWSASLPPNNPDICPKCQSALSHGKSMIAEEILIPASGVRVYAAQRTFQGECPRCGPVWTGHRGHHSTRREKHLKDWVFPKDVRAVIRNKLAGEERKVFNLAIEGKLVPTEEQLQRWKFLGGFYRL